MSLFKIFSIPDYQCSVLIILWCFILFVSYFSFTDFTALNIICISLSFLKVNDFFLLCSLIKSIDDTAFLTRKTPALEICSQYISELVRSRCLVNFPDCYNIVKRYMNVSYIELRILKSSKLLKQL